MPGWLANESDGVLIVYEIMFIIEIILTAFHVLIALIGWLVLSHMSKLRMFANANFVKWMLMPAPGVPSPVNQNKDRAPDGGVWIPYPARKSSPASQ